VDEELAFVSEAKSCHLRSLTRRFFALNLSSAPRAVGLGKGSPAIRHLSHKETAVKSAHVDASPISVSLADTTKESTPLPV